MSTEGERRTMRRNIRELPRAAWILILGNFVNWFASFAIPFLALYLVSQGYGVAKAGTAVAAYGLGEILAGGLAGHLADRVGRRNTMAASMLGSAATILALYFAGGFVAILIVAFLAGLATEGWRPASRALMTDLIPEGQRVTAFAMVRLSGNLAFALGGALAGFLADRSFLWLFVMDAATSAAFAVVALVALPEGRRTAREEEAERGGYASILADRAFLVFLSAIALLVFVYYQAQTATLPIHVTEVAHLRKADYGLLLALNGVLVVLFELPLSSWTMHRPAKPVIGAGFALIGLGFGLTAIARDLPMLMLTVAIWTFGEMISAPVAYAYVADIAPEHLRGRYQGLFGVFFGSGAVTGPAVGSFLFSQSVTGFWILCGLLGGLAALLVVGMPRRKMGPRRRGPRSEPIFLPTPESITLGGASLEPSTTSSDPST
jgi:MFS family permease